MPGLPNLVIVSLDGKQCEPACCLRYHTALASVPNHADETPIIDNRFVAVAVNGEVTVYGGGKSKPATSQRRQRPKHQPQ